MQESQRYLVHMSSHSPFCPKFRCHGNRGQLGEMRLAAFNGPSRKLPIDAKYLANISDTDRVIANFVPNLIAIATGVGGGKCDWQHSMAHPRKPPIDAKILRIKELAYRKQQKLQKVIWFSSTLTCSQCDVGNITFSDFFCFRCASS